MARKSSTKIKTMAPEKLAAKQAERIRVAVNDVGAAIGLPEIQRDPELVEIRTVDQIGTGPRTTDKTVRKLTRVDRLHRSGAIDKRQVEAINLYVSRAEAAMAGAVQSANYNGSGGSTPITAAAAMHARHLSRTDRVRAYDEMRSSVSPAYRSTFEAIVLDNQPLGLVGERLYPQLGKSQVSHNVRELVRTCANEIGAAFGHLLSEAATGPDAELAATMARFERHIAAVKVVDAPGSKTPLSDIIENAIAAAGNVVALLVSEAVRDDLLRENRLRKLESFAGVPVAVQPSWQFGWIVSREAA